MKPATHIPNRQSAIRGAMIFLVFTIVMLVIGGYLLYSFGFGPVASPQLSFIGVALGILSIASASVPFWFFIIILRKLHIFVK